MESEQQKVDRESEQQNVEKENVSYFSVGNTILPGQLYSTNFT